LIRQRHNVTPLRSPSARETAKTSSRSGQAGSGCRPENDDRRRNMAERTADSEGDETQDNKPESDESATESAAEKAKKREREMEESGEENAA
jgi:hypothetical protein